MFYPKCPQTTLQGQTNGAVIKNIVRRCVKNNSCKDHRSTSNGVLDLDVEVKFEGYIKVEVFFLVIKWNDV